MIAVQGPQSRRTLQRIADIDLSELRFFHFLNAKLGGVPAVVARLGFSGELGYECYISTEDTVQAWINIQDAGKEDGITPYGLDALDSLRFEKGFIFFGYEVTEKNNPYEVGLEKWIKLDKPKFLGKEALSRLNSRGPERRLVGLEFSDNEITPVSQPVVVNGQMIGETVAGFQGLTVGKNLAWAFVKADKSKLGTTVTIGMNGRNRPARIVDMRYYDPKGERMRL